VTLPVLKNIRVPKVILIKELGKAHAGYPVERSGGEVWFFSPEFASSVDVVKEFAYAVEFNDVVDPPHSFDPSNDASRSFPLIIEETTVKKARALSTSAASSAEMTPRLTASS